MTLELVLHQRAKQNAIIRDFTDSLCLTKVGSATNWAQAKKLLEIGGHQIPLSDSVKSLGVWWQYNLSASRAVKENISNASKAFLCWEKSGES